MSERLRPIRRAIDWGELGPLRLRARLVAEGVYAGLHRSARRGAGVEFGGFREYVAGDDLRWLDRRSLLRHERLVVRQFETETDRDLCLLVDASASMGFRGPRAPGAKLAYAAVVAAALARIALAGGDPVSLTLFGGGANARPVPRSSGREQFERIVAALEGVEAGGDVHVDAAALERAMQTLARGARRGAIVVVLSDLVDLPPGAAERIAAIGTGGRVLAMTQVLDPAEAEFPYGGHVRLRALEGGSVVETDADTTREQYLAAMAELTREWREDVVRHGGRFLAVTSADDAVATVRSIVEAVR
ncbi:MAG TPA: DUF58 domain-containing protein [Polyangiaceae bacterium]|nr:DUF58 domain-containing protein [Polyangiaceae bacterium]